MLIVLLLIVVGVYVALEWPMVLLLMRGFCWFCVGLIVLMVLAVGYCGYWLVDEGLCRAVDWLGEHAEEFE